MPDEPALKAAQGDLGMKLQCQRAASPCERLIGCDRGGRQVYCAVGQVKGIAVPMEDGSPVARQMRDRGTQSGLAERKRAPADFSLSTRIDSCPENASHELRAQAYTERRLVGCQPKLEETHLLHEERVGILLVRPDGRAKHNDQIGAERVAIGQVVKSSIPIRDLELIFPQHIGETTQVLERDMPDRDCVSHGVSAFHETLPL